MIFKTPYISATIKAPQWYAFEPSVATMLLWKTAAGNKKSTQGFNDVFFKRMIFFKSENQNQTQIFPAWVKVYVAAFGHA